MMNVKNLQSVIVSYKTTCGEEDSWNGGMAEWQMMQLACTLNYTRWFENLTHFLAHYLSYHLIAFWATHCCILRNARVNTVRLLRIILLFLKHRRFDQFSSP